MKLDILAFAAHPDDVELACSGSVLHHINLGYKVGIIDLTKGELGSRGTAETRRAEAEASSKILGVSARENLDLGDGSFENNFETRLALIKMIRKYQPEMVWANAIDDRHPDHGRAAKLTSDACFFSGLSKIEVEDNGTRLKEWRPKQLLHYIQDRNITPDIVVDVTVYWEQRMKSVYAFKTQFYDPSSTEPETPISSKDFIDFLHARAQEFGRPIGAKYGEGFVKSRLIGVNDLMSLI